MARVGAVTEFESVYYGRQYDAVCTHSHICCDLDLTTQHVRDIQSITLYRWPEVVVYMHQACKHMSISNVAVLW